MRRPWQLGGKLSIVAALGLALLPMSSVQAAGTASPAAAAPETWSAVSNLHAARGYAPMIRLGDGTVIIAGGQDDLTYHASAERFNPGTGAWTVVGSIGQAVAGQVATALPGGKALFAGGTDGFSYYGFGDVFDPTAGTWTQTQPMVGAHAYGSAAALGNGQVLVVGGYDGGATLTTPNAELFDPTAGTWTAADPIPGKGRFGATATPLADGRVLVAGGDDGSLNSNAALANAAIFSSDTGWTAVDSMNRVRFDAAAVQLADGRILVAGGSTSSGSALSESEVFDPATGHWTISGYMLWARYGLTMTLLPDGRVLAAGGYSSSSEPALSSAEIYDPTTGGWSATGPMAIGRRNFAAAALADGRVLIAGGAEDSQDLNSAEVYTPPAARPTYPATTYHPLAPARILDSRINLGIKGVFKNRVPRGFTVAGHGGVPAKGAIAVTGILTVTGQTGGGYVTLGALVTGVPSFSTINFPKGDNRANNVTVALNPVGQLGAVFVGGGSTNLLFDVTGYFTADNTGATYKPITPARLVDTRKALGISTRLATGVSRTFQVTGVAVPAGVGLPAATAVPVGALAVTGNLALVAPSSGGWAQIAPDPINPTKVCCSTVNAPAGDIRANGVTVKLNSKGQLSVIWVGAKASTTNVVFDITGYYVAGLGGAKLVPVDPIRMIDTRYHLPIYGPLHAGKPMNVQIRGRGGVPAAAVAVCGNLTVTAQNYQGYATIAPALTSAPATSTLNFPKADSRANGFSVSVSGTGTVAIGYYASKPSAVAQLVMDLCGYYLPPTP